MQVPAEDRVKIFDTTLRDGEQSPGASMNLEEKVQMAEVLAQLNVDVIECGFPASSEGDFAAVRAIADSVDGPTLAGLSRCRRDDIARTELALRGAKRNRAHIFLATSEIHRTYKLRMNRGEVLQCLRDGLTLARDLFDEVEFSAEDAARTEPDFLAEAVYEAIEAGARVINIPDTVGYAVPHQFGNLIRYLRAKVPNINKAVLSVHCHNDLGLAVANSLAAIEAGARQVECTINGIGERAGNCSLEELVMALKTRRDYYGTDTGINTQNLVYASTMLTRITGLAVSRNKAVVGVNAFAHEAGIHQHGVLMHPSTYEIMRPEDVGRAGNSMVLGKHSGRHAFHYWMEERDIHCTEMQFEEAFNAFKRLCDQKKEPQEHELLAIVRDIVHTAGHTSPVLANVSLRGV
jgi:2-isopropylmalate synthase